MGYWGNAMTSDLTPMQKNVLDFTIAFQQEYHMAPIVLEICAHLGLKWPGGHPSYSLGVVRSA